MKKSAILFFTMIGKFAMQQIIFVFNKYEYTYYSYSQYATNRNMNTVCIFFTVNKTMNITCEEYSQIYSDI